jgi:alpha/beta superfamily hydrolase
METPFSFFSDNLKIEALVEINSPRKAIIITHPHPLYGGDMHNPVVDTIRQVYRHKGYTTLRFNFRGTGHSEGRYDDGLGEQIDVRAALEVLRTEGMEQIVLAGYSFGAWVNARTVASGLKIDQILMVSPPMAMIDFSDIGFLSGLKLVITGGRDDIAPEDEIEKMMETWNQAARLEVIGPADHFYSGCLNDLARVLS